MTTNPTPGAVARLLWLAEGSEYWDLAEQEADLRLLLSLLDEAEGALRLFRDEFTPDCRTWPEDCECEACNARRGLERVLTHIREAKGEQDG